MTHQEAKSILGVSEVASPEILKKAFRKKVFECHPDRFIGALEKIHAHRKFVLVKEAYLLLKSIAHVSNFQNENPKSNNQKPNEVYEEEPDLETILKGSFAGHILLFVELFNPFLKTEVRTHC